MKVLVIDDEALVRKGIVSLIPYDSLGIDLVLEAENGKEALKLVSEYQPDIILCDINMPKVNGLDFSRKVKLTWPWIKIAIITGYDYFDYAKEALKIGVEDYVLKPIAKDDVTAVLLDLIKRIEKEKLMIALQKAVFNVPESIDIKADASQYKTKILNEIENHFSDTTFSIKHLAEAINLTDNYLSTLFKKLFGISFSEYMIHLRLEKSKIYLLTTDLKHYEIAEKIGISDANYFSSLFKKHYGISPSHYKESVLSKRDEEGL